jgi:hypothetical protein
MRQPPLHERIDKIRAEIDVVIDKRVAEIAKDTPGVPAGVIRNMLGARTGGCQCAQFKSLMNKGELE